MLLQGKDSNTNKHKSLLAKLRTHKHTLRCVYKRFTNNGLILCRLICSLSSYVGYAYSVKIWCFVMNLLYSALKNLIW